MNEKNKLDERIIIEHNQKKYSILRYCPHQGADLSNAQFEGDFLVCPRHQWLFDINQEGKCVYNPSTIQSVCLSNFKKN